MSASTAAERASLLTPTGTGKVNYSHVSTTTNNQNDGDNNNINNNDEDDQYKAAILAHKQSKKNKKYRSFILSILVSITMFFIILSLQISVRIFARIQTVPMQEYPHILILIICLVSIPIEWILKSGNYNNFSRISLKDNIDKNENASATLNHQYYNSINDGTINFHQIIISKRWMLFLAAVFDISNLCLQIFSLTNIKVSMDIMFLQQISLPLGIVSCKLLFRDASYSYKQYLGTFTIILGVLVYFQSDIYAYSMYHISTYAPSLVNSTNLSLPAIRLSQNQVMWYGFYLLSYLFTGFAWLLRERAICQTDPNDDLQTIQKTKQSLSTWSTTIQFLLAIFLSVLLSFFTSELDQVTDWSSFCTNIQYLSMDFIKDFIDGCYCVLGVVHIESHRSQLNSDIHIQTCSYSYVYIMANVMANTIYGFIALNLLRHYYRHNSSITNIILAHNSTNGWLTPVLDIIGVSSARAGMNIFWWASLISFPLTYIFSAVMLEPIRANVFTSTQVIAVSIVTLGLYCIIIATRRKKVSIWMNHLNTEGKNEEEEHDDDGHRYTNEENDVNVNDVSLGSIVSPLSFKETSSPIKAKVTFQQSPRVGSDTGTATGYSPRGLFNGSTTVTAVVDDRYWSSHHAHEILPWNQPLDYLFPYAGTLHFLIPTGGAAAIRDVKFLQVLNQAYATGVSNNTDDEEEEEEGGGIGDSSNKKTTTRNRKNTLDSLAVLYNKNKLTTDDDGDDDEEEEDVHEYNKNDENENDTTDDHFDIHNSSMGNRGRRSTTTYTNHNRSRQNTRLSTDSSANGGGYVDDGDDTDNYKRHTGRVSISSSSVTGGGGNNKIRESMLSTHSMNTYRSERSLRRLSSQHSVRSVDSISSGDVVVIDQGSYETRVGYAEGYKPKSVFPSVVSSVMSLSQDREEPHYQFSVGASALSSSSSSSAYIKPYRDGVILGDHWNEMEAVYEHCFTDCLNNIDTLNTKVFLTEAFRSPKKTREKTIETMFELFEVQGCYLHVQPVLALFASGLTSGCVVDSGEYSTTVYPVAEGYHLTNSSQKVSYGGSHVTECLAKYFIDKGFSKSLHLPVDFQYDANTSGSNSFSHSQSVKIARDIKEKYGYILTSPIEKRSSNNNNHPSFTSPSHSSSRSKMMNHASHTLPDGTRVSLPLEQLYECTDVLFQPNLMGKDDDGLHTVIAKSIASCSVDLRKELYGNIILAGGNCMLKGMTERITTEMKKSAATTNNNAASSSNNHSSNHNITNSTYNALNGLKVARTAWADSSTAVWKGGSVIASISTFEDRWISCIDYDEYGVNILHEKCPAYL